MQGHSVLQIQFLCVWTERFTASPDNHTSQSKSYVHSNNTSGKCWRKANQPSPLNSQCVELEYVTMPLALFVTCSSAAWLAKQCYQSLDNKSNFPQNITLNVNHLVLYGLSLVCPLVESSSNTNICASMSTIVFMTIASCPHEYMFKSKCIHGFTILGFIARICSLDTIKMQTVSLGQFSFTWKVVKAAMWGLTIRAGD